MKLLRPFRLFTSVKSVSQFLSSCVFIELVVLITGGIKRTIPGWILAWKKDCLPPSAALFFHFLPVFCSFSSRLKNDQIAKEQVPSRLAFPLSTLLSFPAEGRRQRADHTRGGPKCVVMVHHSSFGWISIVFSGFCTK